MQSEDTSPTFLEAVQTEMGQASSKAVAKQIMSMLWETTIAVQGPSQRPGEDALIAGTLISMITRMEEGYELHTECYKNPVAPEGHQRSTAAAVGDEGCAKESIHKKLAILFSQAQDRLEAVGRGSFFGTHASSWLAVASWSAATAAMHDADDFLAAAVLFSASGSFQEALPCPTTGQLELRRETYMLSIQCVLDGYGSRGEDTCCMSLRMAHAVHKKASAALEATLQLPIAPKDLLKAKTCLWTGEMDLAMRQGKYGQMLQLVERAKTEELFTADRFVHIGYVCLQVPRYPHARSAKAACSAALQLMRSQEEPPCMNKLAETVQELYKVSRDEEALALMADIASSISSMDTPAYPGSEVIWLTKEAWNHGCKHARYMRHPQALSFMAAALDLMDLCEDFEGCEDIKKDKERFQKDYKKLKEMHSDMGNAGI